MCDGIHFVWQWHDTGVSDAMAEDVNGVATKLALGDIDDQSVHLELLEQQAKVFFVCLKILASHQDVVKVDEGEIQTMTDNVHQALESLGSILQTEKES